MPEFQRVEDLFVYKRLCELHIDVSTAARKWPQVERHELKEQVQKSSHAAPARLAHTHADRHVQTRIEGVNQARAEANVTIHHLYIARLKNYLTEEEFLVFRERYDECVKMLNGLEKHLEQQLLHPHG